MWEQKAGLRLGFIKWKALEGAQQLSRNLVWCNVEHLEGWESLASPKQSITDSDSWWLLLRECQKILSLPCTLGLLKWLLLKIPLMTENYCLPWGTLWYPDPHFQKWQIPWLSEPLYFRVSRDSSHQGRTPIKTPGIGDSGIASQGLWDMVSRKNPKEL